MITGTTKIAGVMGHPVGHSLSPAMHNAAFQALGMDWCYLPFDVPPEGVADALRGMRALGITGLNVTIPHKPAVYEQMDRWAPSARAVEAVNTVHLNAGLLTGHNTDGEGFARSLESAGVSIRDRSVVLLGAGGAARSVAAACLERGASRITILNRTLQRAEDLAARLRRWAAGESYPAIPIETGTLLQGERSVRSAAILVQCTAIGMHPHEDAPPPIPVEWIDPGAAITATVYDLIYNPAETRFLAAARSAGAVTLNGVEMLVYQGAVAFEIWTGIFPPLDVMRQALLNGLNQPIPSS